MSAFNVESDLIRIILVPIEELNKQRLVQALFKNPRSLDHWKDATEPDEWPLDIIGFDCYPAGQRWKFVLNCGTTEWSWESDWPTLS